MVLGAETLVLERTIKFGVETMVLYGFVALLGTLVFSVGSIVAPISTLTTSVNNNCTYRIITKILSIDFGSVFLD